METYINNGIIFCTWSGIIEYVTIIDTNTNKQYRWVSPDMTLTVKELFVTSITHNSENKAMLDIAATGDPDLQSLQRFEINPVLYTGDDWVADDQ